MHDAKPAVFLDRDGTVIRFVAALTKPAQVRLLPGAAEAIAALRRRGFLVIGITNQPVMEKGLLSRKGLNEIHRALHGKLARDGARMDALYTCPHRYRPTNGCACRKPRLGLIRRAQARFPIDMKRSWFVGDRLRDVETGRRAHIKTILITDGRPDSHAKLFPKARPTYTAKDLRAAIRRIK